MKIFGSRDASEHHCESGPHNPSAHTPRSVDLLFWISLLALALLYIIALLFDDQAAHWAFLSQWSNAVKALVHTIWWGVVIGILMVAVLAKVPRQFVVAIVGQGSGLSGIVRATMGGVLLDLCSHGILMVAAKLYERGVSAGQVIAFLVASPWNSFSLTLLLVAMMGLQWTLVFIGLSLGIAIVSGLAFNWLVDRGSLPANPHSVPTAKGFRFWHDAYSGLRSVRLEPRNLPTFVADGFSSARPVLRWILFGVLLAALVRATLDPSTLGTYFGPTLAGLGLTIIIATIIEICSEGSAPIGADLVTRADAPGNGFAFLMTGVATDYTEIMILKETTHSWKFALFLPFVCVPQVIIISLLLNWL